MAHAFDEMHSKSLCEKLAEDYSSPNATIHDQPNEIPLCSLHNSPWDWMRFQLAV